MDDPDSADSARDRLEGCVGKGCARAGGGRARPQGVQGCGSLELWVRTGLGVGVTARERGRGRDAGTVAGVCESDLTVIRS